MPRIAVIGCGGRITRMLGALTDSYPDARVTGIVDPDKEGARHRLTEQQIGLDEVVFYSDVDDLLAQAEHFDGFAIGTRCHLHTPMAIKIAPTGLPLFLEKPIATSFEELHDLRDAWAGRENKVVVSFPMRSTPVFRLAKDYLDRGLTGPINQIQAFNNVPYADCYYGNWYRRFPEVGGLWLQKATHDFDYLNLLVGARPMRVAAMMTQRIFGTGRVLAPDKHGAKMTRDPNAPAEQITNSDTVLLDHTGSRFHAGIRNQDAGSAIIWYENGVVVSYDQNFVSRQSAGRRGAIITGYNGTVEWDWQPPESLRFVDHHSNRIDQVSYPAQGGHGGGDDVLTRAFYELLTQQADSPINLTAGLQSVAMCLAARQAARTHTVQPIEDLGLFAPCEPFDLSKVEVPLA